MYYCIIYFNTCHCTTLFRKSKKYICILSINNSWHYTKRMKGFLKKEEEKVKNSPDIFSNAGREMLGKQ